MVRSDTPIGIKVVCLIWILFALLNLAQVAQVVTAIPLSVELVVPVSLIVALSAAYILVSIGLWKTRLWAWKGALGLVVVGSVTALIQGVVGLPIAFLLILVGIYLIFQRDVFTVKTSPSSSPDHT